MRHPLTARCSGRSHGRWHLKVFQRALLIGNSRWHWAEWNQAQWRFDHTEPDHQRLGSQSLVWSAVGAIPSQLIDAPSRPRLQLQHVPLTGCPPWLGVDRALGAWEAWRREQQLPEPSTSGLLLADAGTVLSLTLLDGHGHFQGGQLMPGLRLQLRSMGQGTTLLPGEVRLDQVPKDLFPAATDEAMRRGVIQSIVAAVQDAQRCSGASLWLCGGDACLLETELRHRGVTCRSDSTLQLQAMVQLLDQFSPGPDH